MAGVEAVPGEIVLSAVFRSGNPYEAPDSDDVGAGSKVRDSLFGGAPVLIEQQPGRRYALKMLDQSVHQLADVRRVRNDCIARAVVVERQRILSGAYVAGMDAAQPERFQMPDQIAFA